MSTYKSKIHPVDATREQVFNKLSHPEVMKHKIDMLPADIKEKLQAVNFGDGYVSFSVPPMGEVKFMFTQLVEPELIVIGPESSPVPVSLSINIGNGEDGKATLMTAMDIELNIFLRQMVGSKIEDGIEKMAEMLAKLPYGD